MITKYIYSTKISGDTQPPKPGTSIEYYIEYLNNGFAPAYNVIITDTLPNTVAAYKNSSANVNSGCSAVITFSQNNCLDTFTYTPSGTVDVNVTNIKFDFINALSPKINWPASGIVKYILIVR